MGINTTLWHLFLVLIATRPFITSWVYPNIDLIWHIFCSICVLALLFSKKDSKLNPKILLPLSFFLLVTLISGYTSFEATAALKQIYEFFNAFLIFWLVINLDEKKKKTLLFTIFIPSILIAFYALEQYFAGFKHALERLSIVAPDYQFAQRTILSKRAFATFLSPDMLAGYLILMIPINIAFLIKNFKNRKALSILSIYLLFLCIALMLTKSLGGWVSLIFSLLIFSLLLSKIKKFYSYDYLILSIILVGVSIFILTNRWEQFFDFKNPHNSIVQRYYCYKATGQMILEHPIKGIGLGNFRHYYQKHKPPKALFAGFSHNSYLQLWSEVGIFGIAFFLLFVIMIIYNSSKRLKENKDILFLGIYTASLSFLIHNTIDSSFFLPEVSYLWWAIFGLSADI